jgi:hypothetical protein
VTEGTQSKDDLNELRLYCNATLGQALGGFQLIEEGLKQYIGLAEEIIILRTDGVTPYKPEGEAHWRKVPLGRLLKRFARLTNDDSLVKEIDTLVEDRNQLAHAAFIQTFQKRMDADQLLGGMERYQELANKVSGLADRVLEHLSEIYSRLEKLRAASSEQKPAERGA